MEHLVPRSVLFEELFASVDEMTAADLVKLLNDRLAAAVITADEDDLLDTAGVGKSMPAGADGSDLWARYRVAGLDPARFAPIAPPGQQANVGSTG